MTNTKPKLIEVAMPLADISAAAAREKSIPHSHPASLHLWWARRPLAATRAVIWASLVDDPSCDESLSDQQVAAERERLFGILRRLVVWENSNNPKVLAEARAEIDRCFPGGPPPVLDPFGGGGAIPLEAQRLGLKALSGDLNPVAVLIQKAMLEIPPRFAGNSPVHPSVSAHLQAWQGAQGLAADIEAYGRWMCDEASKRIERLYPDVLGENDERLTPIAWIWARTVESPDPSWQGRVPLVASWTLSKASGKPRVWIEPIIDRTTQTIEYEVRHGGEPSHERSVNRGNGTCIATGAAIPGDYIKSEGRAGRMGQQLIAVIAEGRKGRVYCRPTAEHSAAAVVPLPEDLPQGRMSAHPQYMGTARYGIDEWSRLFTSRQLTALTTFSDLLPELRARVLADALRAGLVDDGVPLRAGGSGAGCLRRGLYPLHGFRDRQVPQLVVDGCHMVGWRIRSAGLLPPGSADDMGFCRVQSLFIIDRQLDGNGELGPKGSGTSSRPKRWRGHPARCSRACQ